MRTFAQKQNQPQQKSSAKAASNTEVSPITEIRSETPTTTRFAHDFSRTPVHTPAPITIQPKLAVSTPGDIYEQEADHIAVQVMRMPEPQPQRACACGGGCPTCQTQQPVLEPLRGQTMQAGSSDAAQTAAPPIVDEIIASSGQPLDASTRAFFEPRFGHDFSAVRIHADASAMESAESVNAFAYTVGRHIVFGEGQYSPSSSAGQHLLAHELVHVAQQAPVRAAAHAPSVGTAESTLQDKARSTTARDGNPLQPANIRVMASAPRLQMQRRGSAGGCGICLGGDSRVAGKIAHIEIQDAFKAMDPEINTEFPVPVVPEDETPPFSPHLDLAKEKRSKNLDVIEIGEIKPLDDENKQAALAKRQLQDYARELGHTYDDVFRLRLSPPALIPFINPNNPSGCPPQMISVQRTEPGIYQYYCEPPWSQLVANGKCSCGRRRRRSEQKQETAVKEASKQRVRLYGNHPYFEDVANRLPYREAPAGRDFIVVVDDEIFRQEEAWHTEATKRLIKIDIRDHPGIVEAKLTGIGLAPAAAVGVVAVLVLAPEAIPEFAPEAVAVVEEVGAATTTEIVTTTGIVSTIEVPAEIAAVVSEAGAAAGTTGAAVTSTSITGMGVSWGVTTVSTRTAAGIVATMVSMGMGNAEAAEAVKPLIGKRIFATADITGKADLVNSKPGQEFSIGGQIFRAIIRLTTRV